MKTRHLVSRQFLREAVDFRIGPYFVYVRPHLTEFLKLVEKHYKLAVWSSAGEDYVSGIVYGLPFPGEGLEFVWSRQRCVHRLNPETMETVYVKDLKKVRRLGFDLARMLVVDDSPEKLARNYGNAVYVKPFEGDPNDSELPLLAKYLNAIAQESDFRLLEKRGWRGKARQSLD